MKGNIGVKLVCALFLLCSLSHSSIISYLVSFTVDTSYNQFSETFSSGSGEIFTYQPLNGDIFNALISYDDNVNNSDGEHFQVPLSAFRLELAGLIWDPNEASSSFNGFRGPAIGSISPVLGVQGGELTYIRGGVYGGSDVPFVDFLSNGNFSARDVGGNIILGTMKVEGSAAPIPEASSLALLLLGISAMVIKCRIGNKYGKTV